MWATIFRTLLKELVRHTLAVMLALAICAAILFAKLWIEEVKDNKQNLIHLNESLQETNRVQKLDMTNQQVIMTYQQKELDNKPSPSLSNKTNAK